MAIYLLHFHPPYKHAKHYLGFAEDIPKRIKRHVAGNGNPLVAAAKAAGCRVVLVRVWPEGTRDDERRLKRQQRGGAHYCPRCSGPDAMKHGILSKQRRCRAP